jgi:hypothetical protein
MDSFAFGVPPGAAKLDASSFLRMRFFEDAELEAAEKIAHALYPQASKRYAAKLAADMETRLLSAELAQARSALKEQAVASPLDTAIWVLAAQAELVRRGCVLHPRVVTVSAATDDGRLGTAYTAEHALRFAVLTRHRGLGLTLNLSAGTLRATKELTLGGAEQLFFRTPERLLLKKPWDFAEMSDREIRLGLEEMQEERYYFHKHVIRDTLTAELAAANEQMEEWGWAAREELEARADEEDLRRGRSCCEVCSCASCQEQAERIFGSSSCSGCAEGAANQLGHMEPGGCCYVEVA